MPIYGGNYRPKWTGGIWHSWFVHLRETIISRQAEIHLYKWSHRRQDQQSTPQYTLYMERETDHVLPFLDVLINNTDPHQSVTTVYRKKTFTGLLTSYLSFCPFTYKLGLIKTLIHRTFKINNTWMGFHTDLQKLSVILRRNLFPENLINKYISKYIQTAVKGGKTQPYSGVEPQETPKFFFKIPYVGHFSVTAQRSIRKLANRLCKPIDLRLVFTTFKVRNLFNVKDAVPEGLRTRVVYKFNLGDFIERKRNSFETYVSTNLSLIFVESPQQISGKRENYPRIANINKYIQLIHLLWVFF